MVNLTPGFGGGIEAQKKGTAASVAAFKAREVDRIRPTFYDGKLGIKGPEELIEQYKIDFAKRLKFPKSGSEYKKAIALGEILSDADLAKKYKVTIGDVERINRVIKKDLGTYAAPDKKRYKTGVIRREELEKVTDLGLEQEYTKLKKGERIGNPDLAHRVSKKYNVTTSNLGLDHPLINRVIVKPNERDISRLYDKRIKIENKYKLKDGTFKKPSKADVKILEKINTDVMDLAAETNGRISAIVNDPTNLNKPYGTFGIDHSKTIGGGIIDNVMLKDVRSLPADEQAFLKLNLLELKKRELNKTTDVLNKEYKDILSKPKVIKRIKNIVDKGNMEKAYVDQAKELLKVDNFVKKVKSVPGGCRAIITRALGGPLDTCEAIIKADPKKAAAKLNKAITATKGPLKDLKEDSQKLIRLLQGQEFASRKEYGKYLDEVLGPPDDVFGSPLKDDMLKKFDKVQAKNVTPSKKLANLIDTGQVTTADKVPQPEKSILRDEFKEANIRWNNDVGAFETANGDVATQEDLKLYAEENPMEVKVGTEPPTPNKSVLKTVGKTLARVGAPLPTALIDGYFINKQMDEGKSTAEIAKDPLNWIGLAAMEPLSKVSGVAEKGGMNAVLRLGLNPATIRGISRFAGLPGLAISTAMTAYDQYKKYQNEEGFVYNLFNKEGN